MLFALALTVIGTVLGVFTGAVQGFFGGKTDLAFQRFIEIWSAMPELYLLIIFAAVFDPSVGLLLILLSLFGWMGLSDYVRAEFLRNRQLDYVRAAKALGLGPWAIIRRHVLPNILIPVLTVAAMEFGSLIAFAIVTETVFAWPGMGKLLIDSISLLDRPVIVAYLLVTITLFIAINLIADLLHAALDPRLRLRTPT